jgi:3-oxoacyl-[acyl-carrier protein] reductase
MDLQMQGKRALVTGASKGIGRVIALSFAQEGCDIAICARGEAGLTAVREELEACGATVYSEAVDVSDPEALRAFVEGASNALGGLDVVVSNASPGSVKGDSAWVDSAKGDLQAFALLAEAARPHLGASQGGSIVALSSTSALDVDFPSGPNSFGAIKAAVLHHASALARQYASEGIRVNTVSPGPIDFKDGAWDQVREARPEVYERLQNKIPLGRLGVPEDVANAVLYLSSPQASFVTGVNLVVDGGLLSRVQH